MPKTPPKKKKSAKALPPPPIKRSWRIPHWPYKIIITRSYATISFGILLGSALYWAILGAHLQNNNADQLVNGYLFQDSKTFHGAAFPGPHTQLLKWPLFWLLRVQGFGSGSFTAATVAVVLLTIVGFAYVLYRINRRAMVFGTICLALASVLALVPPQPYAGGLLPVNMAMLTTRNLEYLLYIASLFWLARMSRLKSWRFVLAIGGLSLLIASDRLFLTFSLGASVLALTAYILTRRWSLAGLASNWLLATVIATILALGGTWVLNTTKTTHIVSGSTSGPYGLVHNIHDAALGGLYGALGIGTNLGANPASDTLTVRALPSAASHRLGSWVGIAFIINAALLLVGIIVALRHLIRSLDRRTPLHTDVPIKLTTMLLWTSIVAIGVFMLSKHYYAVDARYLTIVLFALFVAIATYLRAKYWKAVVFAGTGLLFAIGLMLSLPFANHTYQTDQQALAPFSSRNSTVAQALERHHVQVLVGNYWRVLPIKLASNENLQVMPLGDCITPRTVLTSSAWQPNLHNHSFAYLLSVDKGLTDYPQCNLSQITGAYGRPNASAVIAGTIDKPQEILLFYDHGIRTSAPQTLTSALATGTVAPITLAQLPHSSCPGGQTIMNIVAHQDDDLLFMNPDLIHSIQAGNCIRTIYVTAGDAGSGKFYWLGREQGSEAAYAEMMHTHTIWVQRTVKLDTEQFVTVANPIGNSRVALIFMHLPDGNTTGIGYAVSHYESLARLESGQTPVIHSVDGQSMYSSQQLITGLGNLIKAYDPSEVRTQAGENMSQQYPDHSDHTAVGRYAQKAFEGYASNPPQSIFLRSYIGYPIHARTSNVSGADLAAKEAAFFAYSKYDGGTCRFLEQCDHSSVYGVYLRRQYSLEP